jgi:hypothetical protein
LHQLCRWTADGTVSNIGEQREQFLIVPDTGMHIRKLAHRTVND